MKKNKFIRISILALVLAILMFGVYAVSKTAVLNTNGTVGFIAHDCELSVYGTVTGAVSDPNNMDQNLEQTFYFGNEENQFIIKDETVLTFAESLSNEDLSVKYPSIYFNDAKDEVPNIVFEFHITNLSKYSVKMEITNVINSDKISVIDDTRLKCVIDDWTGLVLIELQLDDYESNIVDLNNFNLVMEFTKRDESEGLSYSPIYETETATSAGLFSAKALNQSEDNIIGYAVSGMGSCEDTNLVIPGRYNGKLVKEIADYAFSGATITSLELPPSIERIGMGAFMSCKSLTKVALPYSLNEIGQQGFEDCSNLTDVEFGDTTTASGVAYDYGSDGTNADDNDNGNNNSPSTPSLKGLNILNNAFANCVKLPNIKLPSFTLNIGESAFLNNVALKAVDLGNKLTEIGLNAFGGCNALPEVKFPQSLEKIYNVAINGVVKITDVAIDGVQFVLDKTIPQIADASNPQNPSEPSNPDDSGNSGSGSGDNTGSGGDNTGSGSGDGSGDSTQEEVAVTKDLFTGLSIISLEIPYGVTRIDAYAFANCESLKEIYLPITLKYIGEYAFSNCVNLENIIIYKNVEYMGENVFDGCDGLKAIYCKMNEEPSTWETNWVGDNYAKVYFNGVLKYYKSKLMTPKNIEINPFDFTINFTESVNASYYEIYLYSNGSLCNTVKITKSGDKIINDLIALGTYDVSICAIGDGKMFTNSEVASAGKLNYTSSELNYTKAFNYNGHTYQLFITNDYNWTQINAFCEYKGGHLVTVTSEAEKQAIYNETSSYYSVIETVEWSSLAMGLYKENGNWKWVTGEPYSYSSWQPGEPTNDGNYGYYVITKNGNWHDYGANCDSGLGNFIVGFILEFDEIIGNTKKNKYVLKFLKYE